MIRKNKETSEEAHIERIEIDNEGKSWQIEFFKDRWLTKIFISLMNNPKSAKQICQETKIPISSVYRRIKKLEQKELLERSGAISTDGVKTFFYKS